MLTEIMSGPSASVHADAHKPSQELVHFAKTIGYQSARFGRCRALPDGMKGSALMSNALALVYQAVDQVNAQSVDGAKIVKDPEYAIA